MKRSTKMVIVLHVLVVVFMLVEQCEAFLYHAAKRSVTKRIAGAGLNPAKAKASGRFSGSSYLSRKPSTALAEKGVKGTGVVRFKEGKALQSKTVDLRRPNSAKLKTILGPRYDLRGAYKKGVIGPKAGQKIGKWAGNHDKALEVRSAKTGGTNVVIPRPLMQSHPRIVRPDKIIR